MSAIRLEYSEKWVERVFRVMCCGDCHASYGSVIEIIEVGVWETNGFGSSVCNTGHSETNFTHNQIIFILTTPEDTHTHVYSTFSQCISTTHTSTHTAFSMHLLECMCVRACDWDSICVGEVAELCL